MDVDAAGWTGEGTLTPVLVEALRSVEAIEYLRVEDAPASRGGAGYAFISNELYVKFRTARRAAGRGLGWLWRTRVQAPLMTLAQLADRLAGVESVGGPDYQDEGMLQFLRTQMLAAPYQTKGTKVVELVRIYEIRSSSASSTAASTSSSVSVST